MRFSTPFSCWDNTEIIHKLLSVYHSCVYTFHIFIVNTRHECPRKLKANNPISWFANVLHSVSPNLLQVFYLSEWRNHQQCHDYLKIMYSRTPLIRPPSESHWCGRIRGMVAREGFVYEQKPLSVTQNVVVWEGWSLVRVVVRQGFYCIFK